MIFFKVFRMFSRAKKKICVSRVTTPKKLGRVRIFKKKINAVFSVNHLSRYEHILMFWNKFVYVIL